MKPASSHACDAWQLLVQLFFAQRANLPPLAAELQLSPAQCHVLHLIEPGRGVPMGQLAETLACDASNVTGLGDRLPPRRLVRPRLPPLLLHRVTRPPATLGRLSVREQRALVRILTRLLE